MDVLHSLSPLALFCCWGSKARFPSRGPQLLADECVTLEAVEHTPRERLERAWDVLKDAAFSGAVCSPP